MIFSIDVDNFSVFNNYFEDHAVGDRALISVAKALEAVAKKYKVDPYRRSGDEFVVLGYFEDFEKAIDCGNDLVRRAHKHVHVKTYRKNKEKPEKDESKDITISVGMASYSISQSVQQWVELAELMMYIAKGSTRKLEKNLKLHEFSLDHVNILKWYPRNRLVWYDRTAEKGKNIHLAPFKAPGYRAEKPISHHKTKDDQKPDDVSSTSSSDSIDEDPYTKTLCNICLERNPKQGKMRPEREKSRLMVIQALGEGVNKWSSRSDLQLQPNRDDKVEGGDTKSEGVILDDVKSPLKQSHKDVYIQILDTGGNNYSMQNLSPKPTGDYKYHRMMS